MFTLNGLKFIKTFLEYNDNAAERSVSLDTTNGSSSSFTVIKTSSSMLGWAPAGVANSSARGYNGTFYQLSNGSNVYHGTSSDSGAYGLRIGDGNTTPTLNDTNLSGNQITTFTATTALSFTMDNGEIKITATYNITNTGSDPFTIKEYGMFLRNSNDLFAMIVRDVLETPITIGSGETGVLTIKFKMF